MPKPNGIERKAFPIFDLKMDEEAGTICAVVAVANNVDAGNEIIRHGFFAKSIERKLPKGVWAHDWKQPIAKTLEAKELLPGDPMLPDSLKELGGAYIKGQFNLDTQRGREAYSDIKFGIIDEFSIGYKVLRESKDKNTGARELLEGDWKEWSPVLVGMNDQTRLISIKDEDGEQVSESTVMTKEQLAELRRAIGAVGLPLAPLDHVWDSSAAEKAVRDFCKATDAPNAEYAKSFFYIAEDGGDKFGDFALAFTSIVDGKMLAVPKRILAVASRLDSMEISDKAKTAIKTKIDGYCATMRSEFKDETFVTPWAAKAAATECTCCANDASDCGCATKDKTGAGICACHADCAKCIAAKCAGLAATAGKDLNGVTKAAAESGETIETLTERVKQLTAKIEGAEDKAGARNSASDKKKLQQIHDNATAMESSVCSGAKGIVVSAQVKGMYEDALAEMTTPTVWQVYYAFLEVLDMIEDLPDMVGDATVDRPLLVEEAIQAMVTAMREAALAKLDEPDIEYVYWAAPPSDFKELSSGLVTEPFDVHLSAVVTAVKEVALRSGVIQKAHSVLIDRAKEKQEFRNSKDGRPVSALARTRKAEMDQELAEAQTQIATTIEKSQSLAFVEPEDLTAQAAELRLRFDKLSQNATVN